MSRDRKEDWIKPRGRADKLVSEEIEFIRDGFLAGRTRYDVARDLRCSCRVVSKYFRRFREAIEARSPHLARKHKSPIAPYEHMIHVCVDARPSVAEIAQREALAAARAARDLTATICGDPPVGYRALDGAQGLCHSRSNVFYLSAQQKDLGGLATLALNRPDRFLRP